MTVAARLKFAGGGGGTIEKIEGDRVELVCDAAFAPGSRPEATLEEGAQPIWIKVHGSRREENGLYRVTGRLLNATRPMLQILKEAVSRPIGGKSSEP